MGKPAFVVLRLRQADGKWHVRDERTKAIVVREFSRSVAREEAARLNKGGKPGVAPKAPPAKTPPAPKVPRPIKGVAAPAADPAPRYELADVPDDAPRPRGRRVALTPAQTGRLELLALKFVRDVVATVS